MMLKLVTRRMKGIVFISLVAVTCCSGDHEILVIEGQAPLLEEPYPLGYPSTAPKPNKVLRVLHDENVIVLDETIEKDYLVYDIRAGDGMRGYVIGGPNTRKLDELQH